MVEVEAQVGLGIMAHTSRAEQVLALQDELDPEFISWDDGSRGEWENGSAVWRMLAGEPTTWSIVLQDDALPVAGFRDHAAAALARSSATAVSFYVGTCRPRAWQVLEAIKEARRCGASWLEADTLLWGVGVALPTAEIPAMLDWADRGHLPYDQRIGQWFNRRGVPVAYTWPSLVDHADVPSLLHDRGCPRVAHEIGIPTRLNDTRVRIAERARA